MKWTTKQDRTTSVININIDFAMKDMEEHATIETLIRAKDEIVRQASEKIIELHLQEIISKINVQSLVNAVYFQSAKNIAAQLTDKEK